jgi:hypothetical protein
MVAILGDWQEKARQDPDWIAWVRKRGCQAFVVLTICRLLYSLETGSVTSKPAASLGAKDLGAQLGITHPARFRKPT